MTEEMNILQMGMWTVYTDKRSYERDKQVVTESKDQARFYYY